NIYWHVGSNFAKEPHAFFAQSAPSGKTRACLKPKDLKPFGFKAWQGLGEDVDSRVLRPDFEHPDYPDSDFRLKTPPGLGFVQFNPADAGPRERDLKAPKVLASFPTAPFDPEKDF
ncbi:MAG TPA: hypothetical protein VKU84_19625, partial [Stellaceae bacterium]|nr:hypothetical protein [Stellaceae bacterium]